MSHKSSENQPTHLGALLSDYILGLASDEESIWIKAHLERCDSCRHDVLAERRMHHAIRSTLHAAGQDVHRHRRIKFVLTKRQLRLRYLQRQEGVKQMSVVLILIFVLMSTFAFQSLAYDASNDGRLSSDHVISATVTVADAVNADDVGLTEYDRTRLVNATQSVSVDHVTPHPPVLPAPVPLGVR